MSGEGKIDYDFDSMSEEELLGINPTSSKFKSAVETKTPLKPTIETKKPEKKEEVNIAKTEDEDDLVKVGNRIDEIVKEEEELKSVYPKMDGEKKKKIYERLSTIVREYADLTKQIPILMDKYGIASKEVTTMSEDSVTEELNKLEVINKELRSIYSKTANAEVRVAIENHLRKLNERYISLYNYKATRTL